MRAIVIITIAAIALTANGAPLPDNTASNEYDEEILFMIKLICPSTNIVYQNEDGTEVTWPEADVNDLKIAIDEKIRQEIQDTYCPDSGSGKNHELTEYAMMGAPGVTNLISSTTIASTTTSETVPPSSTVSNHDFLSVIKFYCPNTQIILLNYNVSESIIPMSINQTGLNFEQLEMLNKTIRDCPQLLSNNNNNGIMAGEYSTIPSQESTTPISTTTDANYEDALFFITQLFCPSTKLIYLNEDGTEGEVPPNYDFKLDDKLKQKIRETNCPEYLSVNKENVSKSEQYSSTAPFESTTTTTTTSIVPIVVSTTDASINTSLTTVTDYENDLLYIINKLCPNTQIMYLNINGSVITEDILPINYTEPILELDSKLKQKIQDFHCPELSNFQENGSKTEEYSTVVLTESIAIANTTSTTTIAPSTTSSSTIAPSTTSTTTIAPSTTNTVVANYDKDILFILQILCSSLEALYPNNNGSNVTMLINQLGLDEKLKQEIEKLNCSEFSSNNENKTTYESPSKSCSTANCTTVIPAITTTTDTPTTTSTEVTSITATETVTPASTTTSTTTGATTVSYYRDLLLMIKQFCPNTKIVYLNNDDLIFAKEINEMKPSSKTNDEFKEKIKKSHCPKFNNDEENDIQAKDSSTATTPGSTTTTVTSTTSSAPTAATAAATTTIIETTTVPTPTNPIPTTDSPITTTTMKIVFTTSDPATQAKPCHLKSVDCLLTNIVVKFLDFIKDAIQSVKECLKQ